MAEEPDFQFDLIPPDSTPLSGDEQLALAEEELAADSETVVAGEEPLPLGWTWAFDHYNNRLSTYGPTPVEVRDIAVIKEWCLLQMRIERFYWPVLDDDIGLDEPERLLGHVENTELQALYKRDIRETFMQHDRITDVRNFSFAMDEADDETMVMTAEVVIDDETVLTLDNVPVTP